MADGEFVSFTMIGLDDVIAKLTGLEIAFPLAYAAALYRQGQELRNDAQKLTPVETGTLKASAFATEPEMTPFGASVTVGFGGAAQSYAVRQHEDLTFRHRVGQAKFLEQPFLERSKVLADNIAGDLKIATGLL